VSVWTFALKHLIVLVLIASTALAIGLPWLRRLSLTAAERVAMAEAVGLAVAGHLVLGLGLVGRLEPAAILAVVVVAHVIARRDLHDVGSRSRRAWRLRPPGVRWLGAAIGALALSPIVLCALYPPLAFDETLYHLPYAREFARTGSLPFLPDLRFPVFPQLVEALFAAVLRVGGDVATHGVSLVATLMTALLIAVWAARTSRASRAAGAMAAAIWLGQPLGVYLAGSGYVEPVLALFTAAAVYCADRWRAEGRRRWLVLAGLLAGSAASAKYLGLLIVAFLSIEIAIVAGRHRLVGAVAVYGCSVIVAMTASYGRLLYHTGNPVFPLVPEIFGSTPWDVTGMLRPLAAQDGLALLRLPWNLVFNRAAVGGMPPFSPLLTLGLPLMLAGAWWNRSVRRWLCWTVGFVSLSPIGAHYVWTVMPFIALAVGVSCVEVLDRLRTVAACRRGGRVWAVLSRPSVWVILCILPGELYGAYRLVRLGPIPTDGPAREAFLTRHRPLFPAVSFVNDRCDGRCTVYALHAEHMVYFASGRFLGDWNGPASFARTLPADGDPTVLLERLGRLGVDYLLVPVGARHETRVSGVDAPGFRLLYSDAAADVYEVSPRAGDVSSPSSR
jgi:4-amino-4-deoxy-L-arabinose transferase-like glycosyltransferase